MSPKQVKKDHQTTKEAKLNLSKAWNRNLERNKTALLKSLAEARKNPLFETYRISKLKGSHTIETKTVKKEKWTGSSNPRAKKVVENITGTIYNNLNDAHKASNLQSSRSYFSMMLLGIRPNKTSFSIFHK